MHQTYYKMPQFLQNKMFIAKYICILKGQNFDKYDKEICF